MWDKERIEYVTRHFSELQGWRIIPFGLYLFAGAAYDATWGVPYHATIGQALLFLLALVAVAAYLFIGSQYRNSFGHVQAHTDARRQRITTWLFVAFLVLNFLLMWLDRATGQAYRDLVLAAWWMLLTLTLLAIWAVWGFPIGWPRRFSMWPIVILLALNAWNIPGSPSQNACYPNGLNQCVALDLLVGFFVIAGGLYNHHLLASTLQPLPENNRGQAI